MGQYSIWVLEYAYVSKYHKSGVLYGAHNQGYVKLPYCYALIKGNGHGQSAEASGNVLYVYMRLSPSPRTSCSCSGSG